MSLIESEGDGTIIYRYNEGYGPGIGLRRKTHLAELMRTLNIDIAIAMSLLGERLDTTDYDFALKVMEELRLPEEIRVPTANSQKVEALIAAGYLVDRISLGYSIPESAEPHGRSKVTKLGHYADLLDAIRIIGTQSAAK